MSERESNTKLFVGNLTYKVRAAILIWLRSAKMI